MRRSVIIIGLLLSALLSGSAQPVNIALNKSYTLVPRPNYALCTDPDDIVQLTDGEYVKGRLWVQKGAVGWHGAVPVICTIDLGKIEPVSGVSWSTAAGVAGVTWPVSIQVLISSDLKQWHYLGDLCEMGRDGEPLPEIGSYSNYKFTTHRMRGYGRYICVMTTCRPYCFVDEIEVFRGEDEWLNQPMIGETTESPKKFHNQNLVKGGVITRLISDIEHAQKNATTYADEAVVKTVKKQASQLHEAIGEFAGRLPADFKTILPYGDLHTQILALNSHTLRYLGFDKPVVWQNNRWDPLELHTLPPSDHANFKGVKLDLMRGEVRGETLNITNPYNSQIKLGIRINGMPQQLNLEMREVMVTDTMACAPVMAALAPLKKEGGVYTISVPAGCTRQIWLSAYRPAGDAGTYRGDLALTSQNPAFNHKLELQVRLRNLDFPKQPRIHVGGWDYVHGKANYYNAPGNLKENLALMRDMYVDSPWATYAVAPKNAQYDNNGTLSNQDELDFSAWDEWLERWHSARNYCVFMSVGRSFEGEAMGTPRFNTMVATWLKAWVAHISKQGLKPHQLVFLLVDEPHSKEHDERLIAWGRAIRAANTGVTLFIDPTYRNPEEGTPEMYALHDVLCPNTPMMNTQGEKFKEFYRKQRDAGKTLWLYSCSGPAKLLDPIGYHRAQAWIAFDIQAKGTFYWAFGCGGRTGDSWCSYKHEINEYAPYFVSPTGVMEGKHSEAIRESVQDYEILSILKDKTTAARSQNNSASWVTAAEKLLGDSVPAAVEAVTPVIIQWHAQKEIDRSVMDKLRIEAMDLLELSQ